MPNSLSENYILNLICVTIYLSISYLFLTPLTTLATVFGVWAAVTTIANLIRIIFPKVRNWNPYKLLMLFDVTTLAQLIRKKMNELEGRGKKKRQTAMVAGTLFYGMSVFILLIQVFFGLTITNIDNGLSSFIPPLYQQITIGSLITIIMSVFLFGMSVVLMGIGFYGKFQNWESMNDFVESLSKNLNKKERSTFWDEMTKKQKIEYTVVFAVTFGLACIEFYFLGFIASPAQTYGTSLESGMTKQVLSVFGNWTNVILAEIGLLVIIGLTFWVGGRIMSRLQTLAEQEAVTEKASDAKT